MPRAEQSTTGLAVETVSPTRAELAGGHNISAEVPEDSLAPHSATSPGFEYQKLTDDVSEVTTGQTEVVDIIVPAEVEPPVPQDAIDHATSGEKAPLLRHDSNRYHFPHHHAHHQVYQPKQERHGLGLEEAEPELFLDFAHFVEGSIPEHSTRGGVDRWTDFKRVEEMVERQQQDDGYSLFSPLPEEGVLPEHQVRGFGGYEAGVSVEEQEEQQQPLLEQMEEGAGSPIRHVNRTVPLKAKVSTAFRAVGKDVTNTFADMRHQFAEAVGHIVTDVGRRMSLDEQSEHNAAQRCLQQGKMAEYHEHQTFANVCAALSAACRNAVAHEARAPNLLHPRSPLLSATQQNEARQHNLEPSIPSSHANEAFDVSLSRQSHELEEDEDVAESSNVGHGISEIPLGGAAEEEAHDAEPIGEQVRHAADEIYQQLEMAAEDSVAELEHIMDVAEARQHVRALENLANGNEISYHFREAASHAAAAISTLLHRAHEHPLPMSSSNNLATQNASTNINATSNVNLSVNTNVEARVSGSPASAAIPVYPVPPTPTPSPASGYTVNTGDIPATF